jgi:hypothetical protein
MTTMKKLMLATALSAAMAVPAFAQQPAPNSSAPAASSAASTPDKGTAAAPTQQQAGFVQDQNATEWRGSKLIGTSVYGPDNKSIGSIDDVIIASNGSVKAVVVGVGGFLGVGEKDVAIPFHALNVTRKQNSSSIDKVTVSYDKDQLKSAPKFTYYQASGASTTGASTGSAAPMSPPPSSTKR